MLKKRERERKKIRLVLEKADLNLKEITIVPNVIIEIIGDYRDKIQVLACAVNIWEIMWHNFVTY